MIKRTLALVFQNQDGSSTRDLPDRRVIPIFAGNPND